MCQLTLDTPPLIISAQELSACARGTTDKAYKFPTPLCSKQATKHAEHSVAPSNNVPSVSQKVCCTESHVDDKQPGIPRHNNLMSPMF